MVKRWQIELASTTRCLAAFVNRVQKIALPHRFQGRGVQLADILEHNADVAQDLFQSRCVHLRIGTQPVQSGGVSLKFLEQIAFEFVAPSQG